MVHLLPLAVCVLSMCVTLSRANTPQYRSQGLSQGNSSLHTMPNLTQVSPVQLACQTNQNCSHSVNATCQAILIWSMWLQSKTQMLQGGYTTLVSPQSNPAVEVQVSRENITWRLSRSMSDVAVLSVRYAAAAALLCLSQYCTMWPSAAVLSRLASAAEPPAATVASRAVTWHQPPWQSPQWVASITTYLAPHDWPGWLPYRLMNMYIPRSHTCCCIVPPKTKSIFIMPSQPDLPCRQAFTEYSFYLSTANQWYTAGS